MKPEKMSLKTFLESLSKSKVKNEAASPLWREGFDACIKIIKEAIAEGVIETI